MLSQHPQLGRESASSSPSKSPEKKVFLPTTNVFNFGSTGFGPAKSSPVKNHPSLVPENDVFSSGLPPSFHQPLLPTSSDALPNMAEISQEVETSENGGWNIPAVRPGEPSSPSSSVHGRKDNDDDGDTAAASPSATTAAPTAPAAAPARAVTRPDTSPRKPGAAAKIGRRQAWLKFMAYEGAVQICLDSLLQGRAAPATGFLLEGCRDLREALSLGMLLLPAAGHGQGNETAIYWDDREEGGGAVVERITISEDTFHTSKNLTPHGHQKQQQRRHKSPPPRKPAAAAAAVRAPSPSPSTIGMSPLGNAQQAQQQHITSATTNPTLTAHSIESMVPIVEATVVRVVGCRMLTSSVSGNNRHSNKNNNKSSMRTLAVVMHPAGAPLPEDSRSWTSVNSSGAIEMTGVLRLLPDAPRGTVLVELYDGDLQVAAGTVQAAELQRCALQHDSLDDEAPMAAGFLRNLMPGFARRSKDAQHQGGSTSSSMTWVRLVDSDGADAGHVVVAAKVVTSSEASMSVGPRTASPSGTSVAAPSPPPPAAAAAAAAAIEAAHYHYSRDVTTLEDAEDDYQQHRNPLFYRNTTTTTTNNSNNLKPRQQQQQQQQVVRVDVRGAGIGGRAHTSGGYLHVNSQHVYDVLLEAALGAAGCGPTSLTLDGPWAWLVDQHAQRYGVRKQYATLAHLRWVVRTDNAAPTAACLSTLVAELGPLLQERDSVALTSAELALLGHAVERVDQLLTSCFENYFALSEDTAGGLADGMLSVRGAGPPPALKPAVELLEMTRSCEPGPDGGMAWLASRLRSASRKRFQALLAATEARRGPTDRRRTGNNPNVLSAAAAGSNEVDDPSMAWAYSRVEELCSCVINELRADESIAAANIIPAPLSLPATTAVEYIKGTIAYLHRVLDCYPPPAPSPAAVRLVESVGRLQSFVERHGFEIAAVQLNSRDIFGGFVAEWVSSTAASLRRTLRALDRAGPPALSGWADLQTGVKTRVSPLVEGMLSEVEAEMKRYARIVAYWPAHGQDLEAALVSVLRDATAAASGQCGLVQSKVEDSLPKPVAGGGSGGDGEHEPVFMHRGSGGGDGGSGDGGSKKQQIIAPGEGKRFGRVAWRWVQVGNSGAFADAPAALRKGINPHQALLLNSLRRLLAVVPQLEHALRGWCAGKGAGSDPRQSHAAFPSVVGGPDGRLARDAPDLGAHWAQLVKEIRTEYYACCTLTVESLAGELTRATATSVIGVLRREALTAAPAAVSKHLRRVLEQTAPNLRWLAAALDGRVFVALARGLWDNAAKDVLRYAEDLTDGGVSGAAQGAWRGRQGAGAALRSLDAFYRTELASAMGSDLLDRDLTPPQHAQRAAALLADNTTDFNMSFDVY